MQKTLAEYIKELPDEETRNKFKAELALHLKKGPDMTRNYIRGSSLVPDEIRVKINEFAKSEFDYDRAHLEYKQERINRDAITIMKGRKYSVSAPN